MTSHITFQAEKILQVLEQSRNRWFTRNEIAHELGKNRLTPYDISLLELLVSQQLIQTKRDAGFSPYGYRWMYGIFEEQNES